MACKDYHKKYYEENKQKFKDYYKQKIKCDICGCEYGFSNKANHLKTKKHMKAVNSLGYKDDLGRRIDELIKNYLNNIK